MRDIGVRPFSLYDAKAKVLEFYGYMGQHFATVFPLGFKGPKVVIALDEAHLLHEVQGFRYSTEILRVINSYSGDTFDFGGIWVLFASTIPEVLRMCLLHPFL